MLDLEYGGTEAAATCEAPAIQPSHQQTQLRVRRETNPIKFNSSPPLLKRQRHKYYEKVYRRV